MNRDKIEQWLGFAERDRLVTSGQVFDNIACVSLMVEYFKDLGDVKIEGEQVAKFFEAVFVHGRYWTDATDDAKLPEFPEWLID